MVKRRVVTAIVAVALGSLTVTGAALADDRQAHRPPGDHRAFCERLNHDLLRSLRRDRSGTVARYLTLCRFPIRSSTAGWPGRRTTKIVPALISAIAFAGSRCHDLPSRSIPPNPSMPRLGS